MVGMLPRSAQIKIEMRKARFSSRSEAGRYAANIRWQGQGKLDRGQANGYDGDRKGEPVKTTRAELARALRQAGFKASQSVGRGQSSGFRTWKFGNQMFLQHAPSTGVVMPNEQIRAKTLEYADALRQAGFEIVDDTIYGDGRVEIIGKTQNVSENVDARPTPGRYQANVTWDETRKMTEPKSFGPNAYIDPAVWEKIYVGESKNVKGLTLYKPMIGSKARSVFGEYTSPKGQKFTIVADRGDVKAYGAGTKTKVGEVSVWAPTYADGIEIFNSKVLTRFRRQGLGTAMLETIASLNEQSISFSNALSEEGRAWMEGASNA
jgi:hypothetical protein